MRDGGGKSISGIIWLYDVAHIKILTDGFLHLLFIGFAIASKSLLYLEWRVLVDGEIVLASNKNNNAARLGYRDAGSNVLIEEKFFD